MNAVFEKAVNAHLNGHINGQSNGHRNGHANGTLTHDEGMVDIAACLTHHFEAYYTDLDGVTPRHLYQMMLSACEKPLLEWVMGKTRQNQSLASEWLGMNRDTLRKKLQQYDLL